MNLINQFTDKIISDLDVKNIKPNQWIFPTVGLRVFNKDGKGLIATVVPGNEEYFTITSGFYIIGSCEYNGILYLASVNDTTGEGEIGCFPSASGGSFVKTYSPLKNYLGREDYYLRSVNFNFNGNYGISMLPKVSYDGSVDLYLCDYLNPNRVINTGFTQSAVETERKYKSTCFNGSIDLIPTSKMVMGILSKSVQAGGRLNPGNIYLYFRYVTTDYARTTFVKEVGPFFITAGDSIETMYGKAEKDWVTNTSLYTDKTISVSLNNLDENYKYIEIAVVRRTAMVENAVAGVDCSLINRLYAITGPTIDVLITGDEEYQSLSFDDVMRPKIDHNISKSHTVAKDRYLMANMKKSSRKYDRVQLKKFASFIIIGEDHTKFPGYNEQYKKNPVGGEPAYNYGKPSNVSDKVGYFKDQIYPFAAVFLFDDGTMSEAFPCKGNLKNSYNHDLDVCGQDCKGLYKFQSWEQIDYYTTDQRTISNVNFNIKNAIDYYYTPLSESEKEAYFGSVVGVYFVRGDRIDNFICQGVLIRGFNGMEIKTTDFPSPPQEMVSPANYSFLTPIEYDGSDNRSTEYNPDESYAIPLFRGIMPVVRSAPESQWFYGLGDENGNGDSSNFATKNYKTLPDFTTFFSTGALDDINANRYGLFAPDICFEQQDTFLNDVGYIQRLRYLINSNPNIDKTGLESHLLKDTENLLTPSIYGIDLVDQMRTDIVRGFTEVKTAFVDQQKSKNRFRFSSYFAGEGSGLGLVAHSTVFNRNIGLCRYIGIRDDNGSLRGCFGTYIDPNYPNQLERITIVNLYKQKNDTAFAVNAYNAFNPGYTFYSAISEIVGKDKWSTYPDVKVSCFKGDCFLQQTWMRTHRWFAMENAGSTDTKSSYYAASMGDQNKNHYQHGFLINIVTENKYNTQARGIIVAQDNDQNYKEYSFYPKVLNDNVSKVEWTVYNGGEHLQESWMLNDGYNQILSGKRIKGIDLSEPLSDIDKPNRVYASDVAIIGSYIDGFRNVQSGSFKDYNLEGGSITAIWSMLDFPFIIQENNICQMYIGEQKLESNDGSVVIGYSTQVLNEQLRKLCDFGSQHLFSIGSGNIGVYGFDYKRRILWRVISYQQQGGGFYLRAESLIESKLIRNEIKNILDSYSPESDITSMLPDTPYRGIGIVFGCDPEFKEIFMSFMLRTNIKEPHKTLVYDELLDGFRGMYPFSESKYMTLGNSLLSTMHYYIGTNIYRNNNKVFIFNRPVTSQGVDNYNVFFGNQQTFVLSFVVNGMSDDSENNYVSLRKIFQALLIECKRYNLSRIIYQTLYQMAMYEFSVDSEEFWMDAEYNEHKWAIPLAVQTSEVNDDFEEDSELRGMWMKVTIEYTGNKDLEIREVQTTINISAI